MPETPDETGAMTVDVSTKVKPRRGVPVGVLVIIAIVAVGVGVLLAALIANISGKKAESTMPAYQPVVVIDSTNQYDPSVWGQNFPNEYNGWAATADFSPSMHLTAADKLSPSDPAAAVNPAGLNASDAAKNPAPVNALPADTDVVPRDWVTPEKITQDPRLVTMWNGYAFAEDYRHLRGHAYMSIDQRDTLRVSAPPKAQPGACINCHVSLPGVLSILGNGTVDKPVEVNFDLGDANMNAAFDALNTMKYLAPDPSDDTKVTIDKSNPDGPTGLYGYIKDAGMEQPIGCIDCHDPATMQLRVTRPALINGLAAEKAAQGIQGYDVNKDATTAEMRVYVCAQCHVEYYFAPAAPAGTTPPAGTPKANTLTFPWGDGGTDIDTIFGYYEDPDNFPATGQAFTDYTNALTGAGVLKAQHPEFESWSEGIHAANGVTCADCHMAYQRVSGQKVTNHDIASPINNLNSTCGTCHTASDQSLLNQITTIQARYTASRDTAMDAVTQLINAIAAAKADGSVPQAQIDAALSYQAKAAFYADYGYSENSYGFHAPDYFQRIFNESLDASRQGQLVLMGVDPATLAPSDVTVANQQKTDR